MPNRPMTQTVSPMLLVKSIEETYRFYTNVLGFLPGMTFPGPDGKWGHAGVSFGDVHLMFGRADQAAMETHPAIAKTTHVELTKKGQLGGGVNLYINLGPASVDQYYRTIRERGAKPLNEPETKWWGDRVISVTDPDGFMLTFAESVADFDPTKMPKK
jgi:uncharacterized glyoxalase superfamily protein PhnB